MTKSVRRRLAIGICVFATFIALGIASHFGAFGPAVEQVVANVVDAFAVGYFWLLERQNHFALLGTVFAIIVGSYGTYRILINWNAVRRVLFRRYLEDEEKGISSRKIGVSRHFQVAKKQTAKFNTTDVHSWIDDAIRDFDDGKLGDAKVTLAELNGKLQERIDFAASQERIAKRQQAAVHLFLGSIDAAQFKPDNAVAEFRKALTLTRDQDADALKYIAEQRLAVAEREQQNGVASVHAQEALTAALQMKAVGDSLQDKRIQAEALLLQGRASLRKNSRQAGRDSATDGIRAMDDVARNATPNNDGTIHRDDSLNGQLNELLGDAQVLLGAKLLGDAAYAKAIACFQKFDGERKAIVEKKRARAALNETEEALRPWPHPNGERLEKTTH